MGVLPNINEMPGSSGTASAPRHPREAFAAVLQLPQRLRWSTRALLLNSRFRPLHPANPDWSSRCAGVGARAFEAAPPPRRNIDAVDAAGFAAMVRCAIFVMPCLRITLRGSCL